MRMLHENCIPLRTGFILSFSVMVRNLTSAQHVSSPELGAEDRAMNKANKTPYSPRAYMFKKRIHMENVMDNFSSSCVL